MHGHLITVEVSIECGTNKRMQLNSLTFNQDWLKSLNTKAMQCWCPVQHNRVLANDFLENIPNFSAFAFYKTLCCLNRRCFAAHLQLREDEWLEQL